MKYPLQWILPCKKYACVISYIMKQWDKLHRSTHLLVCVCSNYFWFCAGSGSSYEPGDSWGLLCILFLNCLEIDICLQWDRVNCLKVPCPSQEVCHIHVKITITRANCKYIEYVELWCIKNISKDNLKTWIIQNLINSYDPQCDLWQQ
jgi:hypothetical protein